MSGTSGSGHGPARTAGPPVLVLIVIGISPLCSRPDAGAPSPHDQSLAATPAAVHRGKPWILWISAFRCPHRVVRKTLRRRIGDIMTEAVILINAFEVPAEDAENFIAAWVKTRDYLQTQPGYVDTALHQAVAPN